MCSILYISATNYDQKHLENSKIGLENSWIFFFQKSGNPAQASKNSPVTINCEVTKVVIMLKDKCMLIHTSLTETG